MSRWPALKRVLGDHGGNKGGRAHVTDADALHFARVQQFLHLLPRIDVVVRADDIPLAVWQLGEAVVIS